jgi:hypothetical protein
MGSSEAIKGDLETHNPPTPTSNEKTSCRRISFHPHLKVILVPSRVEYKCAGLCPILWWSSSDFFSFQQSAHLEVHLLAAYENIGKKEARSKLYQPDNDVKVLENMNVENDYYLSDEETDLSSDEEVNINEFIDTRM